MPKIKKFTLEQINKIIELYNKKLSLLQIGIEFEISKNVIRRILKENNINIRTTAESLIGKPSKTKGIKKSKSQRENLSYAKKLKLSDGSWYPCIPDICWCHKCGKIVYNGHKYIVGHQLKILIKSKEHKLKIGESNKGKKRTEEQNKINSEKIKEYYKNNPKAGKEISNRQYGKNNNRYGKISPNSGHGIRSYYPSPFQGEVCFRSSYELAYAQYLDSQKILWMYELETFELSGDMTYTPDFFLPKQEKFVEIKGYMSEKSKLKTEKFKEEYPWELDILFRKDLRQLKIVI
jgi:hypothetical protein